MSSDQKARFVSFGRHVPLARKLMLTTALTAVAVMVLAPVTSQAATYTVTSATDNGLGTTAGTLSWAITQADANPGSTIALATNVTTSTALPAVTANVTISGAGYSVSGNNQNRVFFVNGGSVTIQNVTITNGKATGGAGSDGGGGGMGAGGAIGVSGQCQFHRQHRHRRCWRVDIARNHGSGRRRRRRSRGLRRHAV
jgi:hypothetical protein